MKYISCMIDLVTDQRSQHYGKYELNMRREDLSLVFWGYFRTEEAAQQAANKL